MAFAVKQLCAQLWTHEQVSWAACCFVKTKLRLQREIVGRMYTVLAWSKASMKTDRLTVMPLP